MSQAPTPVDVAPSAEPDAASGAVATRRCGRCRGDFPLDTELGAQPQAEWWLCPPCRDALLGVGR